MKDNKGFDGLNDLGSDIDDLFKEDKKQTHDEEVKNSSTKSETRTEPKTSETETNNETSTSSTVYQDKKTTPNKTSSAWLWFVGLVIVAIIIGNVSNKASSSSTSKSYDNSYSNNSYSNTKRSDDYLEKKPEAYTSVLDKHELLYCEAEKVRLDAVQYKINKYSSYEIDKYNNLSDDYNSRCSNKQYYKTDMYYVERNIKAKKYQLQQEGLARFGKSNSSYQTTLPTYKLTIQATPSNARIRIMNIKPKYYDGIKLKKGKYHIIVDKHGYYTIDQWIDLNKDEYFTADLQKKAYEKTVNSNQNNYTQSSSSYSPTYTSNTSNSKYVSAHSDQECYNQGMYPAKHYSDGSVLCSKDGLAP